VNAREIVGLGIEAKVRSCPVPEPVTGLKANSGLGDPKVPHGGNREVKAQLPMMVLALSACLDRQHTDDHEGEEE